MERLFTDEQQIEKLATIYLDRDSTTWVKSIITEFLSQYPQLQNQQLGIQWKKKDPNKGYAVGAIQVLGGSVPIIVNNFIVSPLDVIMFGNASIPLTPETLQEMLSNTNAFRGATNVIPKSSLDLFNDSKVQWSPTDRAGNQFQTEGIVRDAVKVASFIGRIEHIDKDAVHDIFKEIKDNNLLPLFEQNGTSDILEKLSSLKYTSKESEIESFLRELDIDRQFLYEDANGNKFVKQANSKVDYTWTIPLDGSEELKNMINSENFSKIAKEECMPAEKELKKGEKGHFMDKNRKSKEMEIMHAKKHKKLEKTAFFTGFDGSFGLFIDKNGNFAEIPVEIVKKAHFETKLEGVEPKKGDYGVFIAENTASKPFTVDDVVKIAGDEPIFEVYGSNLSNLVHFIPNLADSGTILASQMIKNAFFVPKGAYFVKLAKNLENYDEIEKIASDSASEDIIELVVLENMGPKTYIITNSDESDFDNGIISKNASFISSDKEQDEFIVASSTRVRNIGDNNYAIVGSEINKSASLNDTLWTLIHWGANEQDIAKVAKLQSGEECAITNNLIKPTNLSEIESKATVDYEKIASKTSITKLLVKEAAALGDRTTVDAVLSLGLMKKYNILEYIQLIPDYERVIGELAKLLVMIRLGLANVAEVPVKTAMEALTTTVTLLKQLQKVNK